jgi:hypothetical protein
LITIFDEDFITMLVFTLSPINRDLSIVDCKIEIKHNVVHNILPLFLLPLSNIFPFIVCVLQITSTWF